MSLRLACGATLVSALLLATAVEAQTGALAGRVTDGEGYGVSGIEVAVEGTTAAGLTDANGDFLITLPPGLYEVILRQGSFSERVGDVEIRPHDTTRLRQTVAGDDDSPPGETTVRAASLQVIPLREAPVAMVVVSGSRLSNEGAHGQLPKLLEGNAGLSVAQGGISDLSLTGRSFNDNLARRLTLRVDGRDPSMLFLGGQEWPALALPVEDYAQAEVLLGPASALYGDAAGGTLALFTKPLRNGRRGSVRLGGGDDSSLIGDLSYTTPLGSDSHLRIGATHREGEGFAQSRDTGAEYSSLCSVPGMSDCLPQEAVALRDENEEATTASLRFDHDFDKGALIRLDGGISDLSNSLLLTDFGRMQVIDAQWVWGRASFDSVHWSLDYDYRQREADEQLGLSTGDNYVLDESAWRIGLRTSWQLSERLGLVAGARHIDESVGTTNVEDLTRRRSFHQPATRDGSLLWENVEESSDAVFGQIDLELGSNAGLLLGTRYDDSSYYEPRWSSRASLFVGVGDRSSLRFGFNQGFQAPTYAQRLLQVDVGPAANLAVLEPICAFNGYNCGFDFDLTVSTESEPDDPIADTRALALGNKDLKIQESQTLELGFRTRPSRRVSLDLGLHSGNHKDFISGLLPQLGTSLGRVNPAFGPYEVPSEIDPTDADEIRTGLADILGPQLPYLSTNIDRTPILAMWSYTNLGEVDTLGADLLLKVEFGDGWSGTLDYSYLDYDLQTSQPGLDDQLLSNVPENRAALSILYSASRWSGSVRYRWADDFRWSSGPFSGEVPSFETVDLFANVRVASHVSLGINVANALDEEHYQKFGGDILGRRALATLVVDW